MATSPTILRFPQELIVRIASSLDTVDLGKFRLVCKYFETNLFESFAREFFSKRQFMVEQVSLEALVGIASHKTLAPYLKEVILSTDKFVIDHCDAYRRHNISRDILLSTGLARDLLVDAFSKLPNLRTVGLRDYEGRGRDRDGEDASWRSYGWRFTLMPSDEERPRYSRNDISRGDPSHIFPLILQALGIADVRPDNIQVFLRDSAVHLTAFNVNANIVRAKASPVLHGLKTLLLAIDPRQRSPYTTHGFHNLEDFLQHTPLLQHLRLNFMLQRDTDLKLFLMWLASPFGSDAGIPSYPTHPPVQLEHLIRLDLGLLVSASQALVDVVSKFTNLQSLSLHKIRLLERCQPENAEIWTRFLSDLAEAFKNPGQVTDLSIGWSSQAYTEHGSFNYVNFAKKVTLDANGEKEYDDLEPLVVYRKQKDGIHVREWLRDMAGRACRPDRVFDLDSSESEQTGTDGDDDSESDGSEIEDDEI